MTQSVTTDQATQPQAVLITDMSGFTRTTRQYGIIHFAALMWKMRQVLRALFTSHGATYMTTEADNCLVLFDDPAHALAAALQVYDLIAKLNTTAVDESMLIYIGGVSVGYGPIRQDEGHFSGATYSDTFELGENIAEKGDVAVTPALRDAVADSPMFQGLSFSPHEHPDFKEGKMPYYVATAEIVSGKFDFDPSDFADLSDADKVADTVGISRGDDRVTKFVIPLMQRYTATKEDRGAIDDKIREEYMQEVAVVMYGADWADHRRNHGADAVGDAKMAAREIATAVVTKHGGNVEAGGIMFMFETVSDAFVTTIELRGAFEEHNKQAKEALKIPITGYGLHVGDVLYKKGTEITWGDAVNTASKLGQDHAEKKQFIMSKTAYERIEKEAEGADANDTIAKLLHETAVRHTEVSISGVQFNVAIVDY